MTINISAYEANRSFVIGWFNTKGGKNINRTVSMMAQITGVPCIAIAYWLGVETNWHPDTIAAIKRLTDFYGYSSVTGKPDGAPI